LLSDHSLTELQTSQKVDTSNLIILERLWLSLDFLPKRERGWSVNYIR
jgi:hypothetical protein